MHFKPVNTVVGSPFFVRFVLAVTVAILRKEAVLTIRSLAHSAQLLTGYSREPTMKKSPSLMSIYSAASAATEYPSVRVNPIEKELPLEPPYVSLNASACFAH